MRNKWVVLADLGSLKAYKVDEGGLSSHPRLELRESYENPEVHQKMSDTLTDQAGQFAGGARVTGVSHDIATGERHNIELEQRRRWIRMLAERCDRLLRRRDLDVCWLAAGREINHQLLAELPQDVRAKIEKNVSANLTKTEKSDLLRHF